MSESSHAARALHHHVRRMAGRDPHEGERVATPLELLFDLTFATASGLAASEFAHRLAEGHVGPALLGFGFAAFAISWAWINFSWFSSAYDTDDWIYRLVTMVQMIGVMVLALGLPRMYATIGSASHVDNSIMVLGYVIMRLAMLFQWLRAARADPKHRRACLSYVVALLVAQVGWVAQIFVDLSTNRTLVVCAFLILIEIAGPFIAEQHDGGTPWNAHHIADRYACFAIIALGEGVVGTVATLSAAVEEHGWTLDAALVSLAGMGLTFGLWWVYYMIPAGTVLTRHRTRSFVWGYLLMLTIASVVATGAGLHVAAYFLEGKSHLSAKGTVLATALPVSVFLATIYMLYAYLFRRYDGVHVLLLALTAGVVALALFAASAGVGMAWCLAILSLAPVVSVIGYETVGHRHVAAVLRDDR